MSCIFLVLLVKASKYNIISPQIYCFEIYASFPLFHISALSTLFNVHVIKQNLTSPGINNHRWRAIHDPISSTTTFINDPIYRRPQLLFYRRPQDSHRRPPIFSLMTIRFSSATLIFSSTIPRFSLTTPIFLLATQRFSSATPRFSSMRILGSQMKIWGSFMKIWGSSMRILGSSIERQLGSSMKWGRR